MSTLQSIPEHFVDENFDVDNLPSRERSSKDRNEKAYKLLGITPNDMEKEGKKKTHRKRKSEIDLEEIANGVNNTFLHKSSSDPSLSLSFDDEEGEGEGERERNGAKPQQRRFRIKRLDRGADKTAFKDHVESHLQKKGYHTRTRSSSTPILNLTPGHRIRPAVPSMDFLDFLGNEKGFKHFLKYLEGEYSQENLLFWKAVETFKSKPLRSIALSIYRTYVKQGSENEVNISFSLRKPIDEAAKEWEEEEKREGENKKGEEEVEKSVFDEAQIEITKLMQRDSHSRFKQSESFEKFVVES